VLRAFWRPSSDGKHIVHVNTLSRSYENQAFSSEFFVNIIEAGIEEGKERNKRLLLVSI
jgi:hypothetical protein